MNCRSCGGEGRYLKEAGKESSSRWIEVSCEDCGGTGKVSDGFPVPTSPLARTTDPSTSKDAAASLRETEELATLQERAFRLVEENPGATANELWRISGEPDSRKIGRRLRELARSGRIHPNGTKRDEVTGRNGIRWYPGSSATLFEVFETERRSRYVTD